MPINESDSPAFEGQAYKAQYDDWALVNDCYKGTRAIRKGGAKYLPQNPKEPELSYSNRLNRSNFWNPYKRTIDGLVGMIFRKNPVLADDVPILIKGNDSVEGHWENIDLKGKHGDVFCKEAATSAINNGHDFILVEMPPPLTDEEGNVRSDVTAQEVAERRPYWVHVDKEQVLNFRTETDANGKTVLTQVTIREYLCEPDGMFGEAEVTQYRVLQPGSWAVYREVDDGSGKTVNLYDSGSTTLPFIPLAPLYATYDDFFQSTPPLLELAFENLRHFRLQSDLDNILHIANVPILARFGVTEGDDIAVGGGALVDMPTARQGEQPTDLRYIEHKATASGTARDEIATSKANMATLGLLLLSQQQQMMRRTATEAGYDYEAESSQLAGMTRGIEDGIELALMFHAVYMNQPSGGSIALNKDFTRLNLTPELIRVYAQMVKDGDMAHETMWAMLAKGELLPPDFEAEEEMERIKNNKDMLNPMQVIQRQRAELGLANDQIGSGIAARINDAANGQGDVVN